MHKSVENECFAWNLINFLIIDIPGQIKIMILKQSNVIDISHCQFSNSPVVKYHMSMYLRKIL